MVSITPLILQIWILFSNQLLKLFWKEIHKHWQNSLKQLSLMVVAITIMNFFGKVSHLQVKDKEGTYPAQILSFIKKLLVLGVHLTISYLNILPRLLQFKVQAGDGLYITRLQKGLNTSQQLTRIGLSNVALTISPCWQLTSGSMRTI
jgi:hypothetical protein